MKRYIIIIFKRFKKQGRCQFKFFFFLLYKIDKMFRSCSQVTTDWCAMVACSIHMISIYIFKGHMEVYYDLGFCRCIVYFGTPKCNLKASGSCKIWSIFITIKKKILEEGRIGILLKGVLLERNFNKPTSYLVNISVVRNYSLTFGVQNLGSNFTPTPLLQTRADYEANDRHSTTIYQGQVFRML